MKRFALLLGLVVAGCGKKPAETPPVERGGKPVATAFDSDLAGFIGSVRFTEREYSQAVRGGEIVDKVEYDEALLIGLKGADSKWKKISPEIAKRDEAGAATVEKELAALRKLVETKGDTREVTKVARSIAQAMEAHLAGGVAPELRATIAGVMAADADIKGERVVKEYRIGIATFAPEMYWLGDAPGGTLNKHDTHLLGVIVREKGTKRTLPSAKVTAKVGRAVWELSPIWGDYLFYGANVSFPEGTFMLEISVEPPQICRHADALTSWVEGATAEFRLTRKAAEVTVEAPKPEPTIADYRIGQDVEQALAEAIAVKDEGDFRIGFIAEGPEPIWVWKGDKLEDRPPQEKDTHHLEIALFERGTCRIVPGATVTLELKNKATGAVQKVEMHNLLSEFAHYGQTLRVEPAEYLVTATVVPPKFCLLERGKFEKTVTVDFDWDSRPNQE